MGRKKEHLEVGTNISERTIFVKVRIEGASSASVDMTADEAHLAAAQLKAAADNIEKINRKERQDYMDDNMPG